MPWFRHRFLPAAASGSGYFRWVNQGILSGIVSRASGRIWVLRSDRRQSARRRIRQAGGLYRRPHSRKGMSAGSEVGQTGGGIIISCTSEVSSKRLSSDLATVPRHDFTTDDRPWSSCHATAFTGEAHAGGACPHIHGTRVIRSRDPSGSQRGHPGFRVYGDRGPDPEPTCARTGTWPHPRPSGPWRRHPFSSSRGTLHRAPRGAAGRRPCGSSRRCSGPGPGC